VSRPPAVGQLHRAWFIATSSVLAVAAAVLFVILTEKSATRPEANSAEPAPPGFSAPAVVVPGSAAPSPPPAGSAVPSPARSPAGTSGGTGLFVPPTTKVAVSPPKADHPQPAPAPENATAYSTIQAESYDAEFGIQVEAAESGSGRHVGFIHRGDWMRYDDVGFTATPATSLLISAANFAAEDRTGVVEVRLDSRSHAPVGSMTIPNNHSWFDFQTYTVRILPTTGVHTVYLTFASTDSVEFANVDWIRFRH
jgi:hypothetical protein